MKSLMEWSLNSIRKNSRMTGRFYFLVMMAIPLFFSLSCNSNSHKNELLFYYFPQKNVYYNPASKAFLYSLNGAKSWSTFTAANNTQPTTLGNKVEIYSKNAEVYRDNESHRKLYGGRLYNITTIDTAIAMEPEAVEREVEQTRKVSSSRRAANRKPATGIGKFIDKIFGKHK